MSDNVQVLHEKFSQALEEARKGGGGGNPPGGGELETRVAALEKITNDIREKLVRLETQLEAMDDKVASKVDLATLASKDDFTGFVRATSKDLQDLGISFQKSITDVQKTLNDQTWKFVGAAAAMATLAFTAARFIPGG